jgi:MFS family permease
MGARAAFASLFRPRSAVAAYFGGALQLTAVSTLLVWLPSYLNRFHGLAVEQAGMRSAIVVLVGSVGIVFWGYLADRAATVDPRAKLLVPAAALVAGGLLLCAAFGFVAPGPAQFALVVAGGFMVTAASGPVPSVAIDVIHPGLRATAAAMVAVVQNLFGLAAGPLIAGALSDAFGLGVALAVMPLFCLASAVVLTLGARAYPADLARVETLSKSVQAA